MIINMKFMMMKMVIMMTKVEEGVHGDLMMMIIIIIIINMKFRMLKMVIIMVMMTRWKKEYMAN